MLNLGILDIGSLPKLNQTEEVIEHTVSSAQLAEKLGYSRYWIGEHHSINCAWRKPDHIIGLIGNHTNKIKIGSAGILLPIHSPLSVAQDYKILNLIYPERIDLGICKGFVEDHISKELIPGEDIKLNLKFHNDRILRLHNYLKNEGIKLYPEEKTALIPPYNDSSPEIWILTSSLAQEEFVIKNKFNISFSIFHVGNSVNPKKVNLFRKAYIKRNNEKPLLNLAVSGIVRETKRDAEIMRDLVLKSSYLNCNFAGCPRDFIEYLIGINREYNVEEIIFLNLDLDLKCKYDSYIKIADQLNKT